MALDGICVYSLVKELQKKLLGQRISKIAQPEKEELLFTFKGLRGAGADRLLISANASLPFLYLTDSNKNSPMNAPNFCMLLRKHISGGRIIAIEQPHMERVICFSIEHLDEMGDLVTKKLYVELMGKHSNIIFCDGDDQIIDSIKHVSGQMSSVREVLPGRPYFIPSQEGKQDPWTVTEEVFLAAVFTKPVKLQKAIYTSFVGLSPVIATELADRADLDGDFATASVSEEKRHKLYQVFADFMEDLRQESFSPCLYLDPATQKPAEFAPVDLTMYRDYQRITDASISRILETYYARKNRHTVMHQKSTDLRKIVSIHLERNRKKYQLQKKQLEDTEKKDRYRIYGEMLHTYGYEAVPGAKEITVTNYYDGQTLTIPLDPTLTALENAKKYFDKYGKLKRTADALSTYLQETAHQITHLESIGAALDLAENEADLNAIKTELQDYGFIKKHAVSKRNRPEKSKPLHFVDPNGFHMYVGKNNYQNDQLTFKFASGGDWWFHAKNIPGSHVIVRSEGKELPDATFEAAAALAAYYSSGRDNDKVEIDYLLRKDVKKPNSAPPGFVIYYTNYSMVATPAIAGLEQVD